MLLASAIAAQSDRDGRNISRRRRGDDAAAVEAAKSIASVMAMNTVWYRFTHLASNPENKTMPARLRMNVLGDLK